jgi:hypothetical protein
VSPRGRRFGRGKGASDEPVVDDTLLESDGSSQGEGLEPASAPTEAGEAVSADMEPTDSGPVAPVRGALPRTQPDPDAKVSLAPGYRTSKRTSRVGKQRRRSEKVARVRQGVSDRVSRIGSRAGRAAAWFGFGVVALVCAGLILWGVAIGVNAAVRWNERRIAAGDSARVRALNAKENLLVIGVTNGRAVGFLALKAERSGKRVLGIAIPDGAYVEVPGQGFERIGTSFEAGPEVSKDAVSNYLGVPFQRYVEVSGDVYQTLMKTQAVGHLLDKIAKSDLKPAETSELQSFLTTVKAKDVWLVPLPVRQVAVGDQRFFEPQREQVADLLLSWWGVKADATKQASRVIVFNGAGSPGIAGKAAQQLIRQGFRVVDSKNADNFDYKRTQILLYHGSKADAARIHDVLGVGDIREVDAPQGITDIIVVIGHDYAPPAGS